MVPVTDADQRLFSELTTIAGWIADASQRHAFAERQALRPPAAARRSCSGWRNSTDPIGDAVVVPRLDLRANLGHPVARQAEEKS